MAKRILLVDDEEEFRFSAGVALRQAGYRIDVAGDGPEALEKILGSQEGTEPFDLLVLDIRMPGMSGTELIDELRSRDISLPVFVMTCFGDKALLDELEGKGCRALIEKPFRPRDLVDRIASLLGGESVPWETDPNRD
jgi:CheY-like chemotaxis protein